MSGASFHVTSSADRGSYDLSISRNKVFNSVEEAQQAADADRGNEILVTFRQGSDVRVAVVDTELIARFDVSSLQFQTSGTVLGTELRQDQGMSLTMTSQAADIDVARIAAMPNGTARSQAFVGGYRTIEGGMAEVMPPNSPRTWSGFAVDAGSEVATCLETLETLQSAYRGLSSMSPGAVIDAVDRLVSLSRSNPNVAALFEAHGISTTDLNAMLSAYVSARSGNFLDAVTGGAGAVFGNGLDLASLTRSLAPLATIDVPAVRRGLEEVNRAIFENIAPAFQTFLAAEERQPGIGLGMEALNAHQPPYAPGIMRAFERYSEAQTITGSDPEAVARRGRLIVEGNALIAEHEQTVIAPEAMRGLPPSVMRDIDALTPLMYAPMGRQRVAYMREGDRFASDHQARNAAAQRIITGNGDLEIRGLVREARQTQAAAR